MAGVPGAWLVGVAVLLLSPAVRAALPPRRLRRSGVTPRMGAYAGAGAFLGFVLPPVLGALPGFVAGICPFERLRLGGQGEAMAALRTPMRSGGSSVLTELLWCWGVERSRGGGHEGDSARARRTVSATTVIPASLKCRWSPGS